ncbi:PH domain-containing protein [Marinobacter sp. P4B1]|uniref:PH domain-containing protein n=1 Tax=Marinobacter sp. P4B1 TaxID=1119533 RepID=UPI00071C3C73|nr:PH domain-containing protein [Marinobacter sp. P4B1]KRW83641.1 hypothetical protein AQ621_16465 [Marinobacter sp. P4B1]
MSVEQIGTGKDIRPAHRAFIGYWVLMLAFLPLIVAPEFFASWVVNSAGMEPPGKEGYAGISGLVRALAFVVVGGIYLMKILIPQLSNRYQVTEDRVVEIKGIIKRDQNTTELAHIRRVNARVGYVGRIMQMLGFKGYGDLVCYTAGSGDEDITLTGLLDPVKVEGRIRELIAEHHNNRSSHTGGSVSAGTKDQPDGQVGDKDAGVANRLAMLEQRIAYLEHHLLRGGQGSSSQLSAEDKSDQRSPKQPGSILGASVSDDLGSPSQSDAESEGHAADWHLSTLPSYEDSENPEGTSEMKSETPEEDWLEPTPKMFGDDGELSKPSSEKDRKGQKKDFGGESVGMLMDEE